MIIDSYMAVLILSAYSNYLSCLAISVTEQCLPAWSTPLFLLLKHDGLYASRTTYAFASTKCNFLCLMKITTFPKGKKKIN